MHSSTQVFPPTVPIGPQLQGLYGNPHDDGGTGVVKAWHISATGFAHPPYMLSFGFVSTCRLQS